MPADTRNKVSIEGPGTLIEGPRIPAIRETPILSNLQVWYKVDRLLRKQPLGSPARLALLKAWEEALMLVGRDLDSFD